jgi:hypothetical protein
MNGPARNQRFESATLHFFKIAYSHKGYSDLTDPKNRQVWPKLWPSIF